MSLKYLLPLVLIVFSNFLKIHCELDDETRKIEIVPPFQISDNYNPVLPKRNHVVIYKCRRDVFSEKIWTVPEWLKGPKSDVKALHLNHTNFFGGDLFRFKVQTRPLDCHGEKEYHRVYSVNRTEIEKNRNDSFEISWKYGGYLDYFTAFGRFRMNEYFLNPQSFCISEHTENITTFEICVPEAKVRKCCPHGTVVKFALNSNELPDCVEILGDDWTPEFYKLVENEIGLTHKIVGVGLVEDFNQSYVAEFYNPVCTTYDRFTPNRRALPTDLVDIRVLENGTVLTRPNGNYGWDRPKIYGKTYIEDYCIDGFINSEEVENTTGPLPFDHKLENQIILFCHQPRNEIDHSQFYASLIFILFLFSSIVLGMIVVVYVLIWRKQNIHGWTTLGFTGSMFLWFVFSAVTHGAGLFQGSRFMVAVGGVACVLNGVAWHFFYVATFTWISILNFDLWSSICSVTPKGKGIREYSRFALYCSVGFGIPIIVVTTSLIIEYDFDIFDDSVIRPMYGQEICSLDKSALFHYAILPSLIFFALNLFFVGSTIVFLCKYMKAKNTFTLKTEVKLFGKFFILMGFTWIFEMISWNQEVHWYWAVFDIYNIIQAVGLFWIFVCKPDIFEQLCQECRFFKVFKSLLRKQQEETHTMATEKSQVFSQNYKAVSLKHNVNQNQNQIQSSDSNSNATSENGFHPPILNGNPNSSSYRVGYELNEMT